ncbi:MAG: GTPase HflX [Acidimicrobiales bacterium]|nr:GTPase HflX [Acidimicrobiales bacterium]
MPEHDRTAVPTGNPPAAEHTDSHRGAFGAFGGETTGLIERSFRERIVIVGVQFPGDDAEDVERSLDELEQLVDTAGADVVARLIQRRNTPEPATYVGKGKAEELRVLSEHVDADTVVFDDELTPAQQFNLERLLGRSAIDRTAVILDIFGQNASSQEGKAQVQLAQYRYRLPRLRGKGRALSQQAGGIGARRGPGETQLEVDRRRILRRMHKLEDDLRAIAKHRDTQRKARRRSRLRTIAIVGYTNAGKSSLLNALTGAGVLVENRLFATLDATTRRAELPGGEPVLLTDTVGFIAKLPHQLVEAFKSTLEVVTEADLLLHVVDVSAPDPDAHIFAVRKVLDENGAGSVPELLVFNKLDKAPASAADLVARHPGSIAVSATAAIGLPELLQRAADRLRSQETIVELHIPFSRGDILAALHREGEVLVESAGEGAMVVRVRLDEAAATRFAEFRAGRLGAGSP